MIALDFEYDGLYLSEFGFIICFFNAPEGANVSNIGANITFNRVARDGGRRFGLTSARYEECLETTFNVCKNPDIFDPAEMYITDDEFRDVARWLCRRGFHRFRLLDEERNADTCYYMGGFNASKVRVAQKLCGIELTMQTDKPFGYGEKRKKHLVCDTSCKMRHVSDETGEILPEVRIKCLASGDLTLKNNMTGRETVIKNCVNGEIIKMTGDTQIIETSERFHRIQKDFNYVFFGIANTYNNNTNEISSSIPCEIDIEYSPIIKCIP